MKDPKQMPRVTFVSLGCAKNLVDSEVMTGYLKEAGYGFSQKMEEADIIVINTCGFIEPARKEAVEFFEKAAEIKKMKKEIRIAAVGCYVQRDREELTRRFPEIDTWLGVNDLDKIAFILKGKPYETSESCFLYDHTCPRSISTPSSWAYVKISEGCSHRCAFCAIPLIKGPYRSRSLSSISQEVESLIDAGVKEINLVSQDSTSYGMDMELKDGLTDLLKDLAALRGIEWIRVLYGYPEKVSDSLLEIMQDDKIYAYLDLPFQHSHPRIVRAMRRGMDGQKALKLLSRIRKKLPDIALRTSLMVGFPGETDEEFRVLINFVKEARFDHLGVFTYSPEKGTPCYDLGDTVKEEIKVQRRDRIMSEQAEISLNNNQKYLNHVLDVLIEGESSDQPGLLLGRGRFQAPEVDGIVSIERKSKAPLNSPVQKVEIQEVDVYDLYGKLKT